MTHNEIDTPRNIPLRKGLILTIGGIVVLFLLGMLLGYAKGMAEDGVISSRNIGVLSAIGATILGTVFACWKLWPWDADELLSPSTKRSRTMMYVTVGIGVIIALAFALVDGPAPGALFSNSAISPAFAIFGLIAWLVVTPIVSWMWWKSIDEHEANAYTQSSAIAAHLYMFIVPAWWIASRAGFLPAQDPMIVFCIVVALWTVIWLYKKYA